ncbi:hypothetical protein N4T77_00090 [Clostridium sp. CX1]|uniref:hypothetical protein n=1 Tax=Clostridium sp. CX1 TaxID=2978346 RepID=UPI0021BF44D2|nr:hypothetical protein [Clostridium sp. CX1]MCT8974987.1 hypothetical protein [Clostridium sp. CX1]
MKKRRSFNTSLDEELHIELRILALRKKLKSYINKRSEVMKYVINKYKNSMETGD